MEICLFPEVNIKQYIILFYYLIHQVHVHILFSAHDSKWQLRTRSFIARWYPSCVSFFNGTILIISRSYGIYGVRKLGSFNFVNNKLKIYNKETGLKKVQKMPFRLGLYSILYLLPSGHVYVHSERTT
jgi:hypothetical protein